MFLTISALGGKIGLARIFSAIVLSIIVGLSMQLIFREKPEEGGIFMEEYKEIKIGKIVLTIFFIAMIGVLVVNGLQINKAIKYSLMLLLSLLTAAIAIFKFHTETTKEWLKETWNFAKMLLPILFIGRICGWFYYAFFTARTD